MHSSQLVVSEPRESPRVRAEAVVRETLDQKGLSFSYDQCEGYCGNSIIVEMEFNPRLLSSIYFLGIHVSIIC